ncbi:uncharacterized protein LOC142229405 [Haematobia irritans]|uniref:uncharacterized protein LOC142229405 n=1 Tax=Haematobia irritans TaxID=7368 RepID=UPI003F507D59
MKAIHKKCSNTGDNYSPLNSPISGLPLALTARIFVKVGEMMTCAMQKGNETARNKVAALYVKAFRRVASDPSSYDTGILLRHKARLVIDLHRLVPECRIFNI